MPYLLHFVVFGEANCILSINEHVLPGKSHQGSPTVPGYVLTDASARLPVLPGVPASLAAYYTNAAARAPWVDLDYDPSTPAGVPSFRSTPIH
jgi:hypothetical protein